jgi:hypothetical protein
MSDNLTNILSNSNKDIDNQKLMDYLSKQLAKDDHHDIEKMMADDAFMDDAVEGLSYFANKQHIPNITTELNNQLQKHLQQRKHRREKRKWKDNPMTYVIILLLLILIIVSYIVIKKQFANNNAVKTTALQHSELPVHTLR